MAVVRADTLTLIPYHHPLAVYPVLLVVSVVELVQVVISALSRSVLPKLIVKTWSHPRVVSLDWDLAMIVPWILITTSGKMRELLLFRMLKSI